MFAPLKRLDSKDGVFVQWIQCSVVFMFGLIINVIRGLPQFNLIASIGEFLYATGNVALVPIVAEMGIGLGMLIWGSVQPYVQSNLVLPSIAYGILWSIGMTLFIVSNKLLSQTVSFPITVRVSKKDFLSL
uniref:Uncharacterized protein n=3 Tax=Meloidogyne TaxID=189290 RepID=A0A6V7WYA7_MELEN|nr:unnamed protein product [Meloidogyne enterolobii]CAD2203711.1 unnamed protein product [Meloidogyne enterolobii]